MSAFCLFPPPAVKPVDVGFGGAATTAGAALEELLGVTTVGAPVPFMSTSITADCVPHLPRGLAHPWAVILPSQCHHHHL
eukprot:3195174-Alexandrium_andersonii.AAC.1